MGEMSSSLSVSVFLLVHSWEGLAMSFQLVSWLICNEDPAVTLVMGGWLYVYAGCISWTIDQADGNRCQ